MRRALTIIRRDPPLFLGSMMEITEKIVAKVIKMEIVRNVEVLEPVEITFYLLHALRLETLGSVKKDDASVHIHHSDHPGDSQDVTITTFDSKTVMLYESGEETVIILYDYEKNRVLGLRISKK